jgi:hypothetical protein
MPQATPCPGFATKSALPDALQHCAPETPCTSNVKSTCGCNKQDLLQQKVQLCVGFSPQRLVQERWRPLPCPLALAETAHACIWWRFASCMMLQGCRGVPNMRKHNTCSKHCAGQPSAWFTSCHAVVSASPTARTAPPQTLHDVTLAAGCTAALSHCRCRPQQQHHQQQRLQHQPHYNCDAARRGCIPPQQARLACPTSR